MNIYYDMSRAFIERARGQHRESGMTRVMHAWGRLISNSVEGSIVTGLPESWTNKIFNIEPSFRWMKQGHFYTGPEQFGSTTIENCLQIAGTNKTLPAKFLRSPAFSLADRFGAKGVRRIFRAMEDQATSFIYHYPLPHTSFENLPLNCIPVINLYDIMPVVFRDSYNHKERRIFFRTIESVKRNKAHVIVNSEDTRHSLVCFFAIEPTRIHVVPLGADLPPTPPSDLLKLPDREYLLYVASSGQRRKNISGAILGFREFLKSSGEAADLVIVGPGTESFQRYGEQELVGMNGQVHCMGGVDDATLVQLYRSAKVGIYLSLYEGFGLPILEYMHQGVPVVCSDRTSLPEVAGGSALLVNPLNPSNIGSGISKVWNNESLRKQLVDKGTLRASQLSWATSFSALLSTYQDILAGER
jgi:glycosyltransferase involved in cell wall biosynthesis